MNFTPSCDSRMDFAITLKTIYHVNNNIEADTDLEMVLLKDEPLRATNFCNPPINSSRRVAGSNLG